MGREGGQKEPPTNISKNSYASLNRMNVFVLLLCNIKGSFNCIVYVYCEISWDIGSNLKMA